MLVKFWGTRGSLPSPLNERAIRTKIREALAIAAGRRFDGPREIDAFIDQVLPFSARGTFGGNSSCVELVTGGDDYFLCDLGSGLREFSSFIMAGCKSTASRRFNIFVSHLHWDHIMGFPFSHLPAWQEQ